MAPLGWWLKFNVNGATFRNTNEARIGDILRDENGSIKIMFSKSIARGYSNLVETLAIREAFIIFATFEWFHDFDLWIKTNLRKAMA